MTHTTADKIKEIYFSIAKELTGDDWDFTADYERWLTTPEGSRLVGELVDDVSLLRELVMRSNLMFPENDQDLKWCDEGVANQPDFFIRLYERLGVKDKID